MTARYDICFKRVIGHEGGYTDDRRDRGNWTSGTIGVGQLKGTKYGISAMSYPNVDIKNLTLEQAKAIYFRDFWQKNKCDELPSGVDYLVFDSAINHGSSRAIRFLQTAVGAKVDGAIGPNTLAATKRKKADATISEFCVARGLFYTEIGTFQTYKRGWFRRLFDTHAHALADAGAVSAVTEIEPDKVCVCPDAEESKEEKEFWASLAETISHLAGRIANR